MFTRRSINKRNLFETANENLAPGARASTFTRVNGSVSCLCNKRLQNWPTV